MDEYNNTWSKVLGRHSLDGNARSVRDRQTHSRSTNDYKHTYLGEESKVKY